MSKKKRKRKKVKQRLQQRREYKTLRRKRKKQRAISIFPPKLKEHLLKSRIDEIRIKKHEISLNTFLNEKGNPPISVIPDRITIPSIFSLEENYNSVIIAISAIRAAIVQKSGGRVVIDFSKCTKTSFSAGVLLKIILDEFVKEISKLDKKLTVKKTLPQIVIRHSANEGVNLMLFAIRIVENAYAKEADFVPISATHIVMGRKMQKHYAENRKGLAATRLRRLINEGLKRHQCQLSARGEASLDGLISEILNNAEDHSYFDSWYASASMFETTDPNKEKGVVGEINFAFLNFGDSIFEGFEKTKEENHTVYKEMEELSNNIRATKKGCQFTKENLFTLYALQDGNSRLIYNEASRGTGTMKFINSFLLLGDYEDAYNNIHPHLTIYSGKTMLICDNKYRPFVIDHVNYLSLNNDNDLSLPPEPTHLRNLDYRFPGTFLTGKIYLNRNHLTKKISDEQ